MLTSTKFCSLIFAAISISVFLLTAIIDPSTLSVTTSMAPVHNIGEDLPPSDTITMNLSFDVHPTELTEVIESTISHHGGLHENQHYHKPSLAVKDLFETASVAFQTFYHNSKLLAVDLFHKTLSTNTKSANRGDLILCGSIEFELLGLGCIHHHHAAHHHHSSPAPPTLAMANLDSKKPPSSWAEENLEEEETTTEEPQESYSSAATGTTKSFESMEELSSIQHYDSMQIQDVEIITEQPQAKFLASMEEPPTQHHDPPTTTPILTFSRWSLSAVLYSLFASVIALATAVLAELCKLCKFLKLAYRMGMAATKVFGFCRNLYKAHKAYNKYQPKVKEFFHGMGPNYNKEPLLPL